MFKVLGREQSIFRRSVLKRTKVKSLISSFLENDFEIKLALKSHDVSTSPRSFQVTKKTFKSA